MVNTATLVRASPALHMTQALWSVVVMGVVIPSMMAKGPASSVIKIHVHNVLVCSSGAGIPDPGFGGQKCLCTRTGLLGLILDSRFSGSRPSIVGHSNGGISDGEGKVKDEKCKIKTESGYALFPPGTGEDPKACKMNQATVGLGVILW
ncbi:unnamed protein product [Tuber aestivum]|uniref:Uncharacterized protein n=1 Tax=Tuber aestivum TaxID=59557 RepID=A0A292PQU3_9PEZI|nr:unnamed protein product [Tuber aestivum]